MKGKVGEKLKQAPLKKDWLFYIIYQNLRQLA